MLLFLSAQDINFLEVGLIDVQGQLLSFKKVEVPPEKYLATVSEFLDEQKISADDLTKIIVVSGPGSFTASRLTVTIANSLSFAKNLPIIGIENPDRQNGEALIKKKAQAWIDLSPNKFVSPVYDRPPNITVKK
ncbi:MAG: hypothetical protein UX09_C0030G0009 [Candidatus Uhrbacteria bacterium GW2011_GWE2_45_35]|uniref:Gcp-like domain-containing protein n=2 Tax=Candidatus Uhriibacteriota TaxID=1752732 RepID=A0A0G1MF34_9BACT|nr:MAG: hypothetical protein UW63_C0024G0008 [Candidatus Uhrbacteria bacterium GW2011_GWF2_44_350]KKU07415.1 MAG: hypothetical protein UX09_C0030G0009 [Candidatus Uhrbacteria bacterium GW2011_GWE2_45_35]HBR80271.1 hypothetical protein [Candidatus Uhrbacteria bacterium]HCU31741.1 hypothetical protein [Candidatus Uhrbacteria bacterium]